MIIRAAVKSDAKTLWALAVEVYSEAFGNSLSAVDLAAELPTNASEACSHAPSTKTRFWSPRWMAAWSATSSSAR